MVNIYCCLANFHESLIKESMESEGERFHSEFKLVMTADSLHWPTAWCKSDYCVNSALSRSLYIYIYKQLTI